jgi:hypothetical protein
MMLKLSCAEATTLMEKRHAASLSFRERVKLAFHNRICDACRKYEQFSRLIEKALHKKHQPSADLRLSDACKERIIKSIQDHK